MSSRLLSAIYVDEAGDPGLASITTIQNKPYYVVGFVYAKDSRELKKRLRRYLKKLHIHNRYPRHLGELKFYLPYTELIKEGYTVAQLDRDYNTQMPLIRTHTLEIVNRYSDGVFAAVVDKRKAMQSWTSEKLGNFVFAETLIVNVMNVISPPEPPIIFYDRGRLSPSRNTSFKNYILEKDSFFEFKGYKRYRGSIPAPIDISSVSEPGIWAADMVAGAFYHKYCNRDATYSNMMIPRLLGGLERLYWK